MKTGWETAITYPSHSMKRSRLLPPGQHPPHWATVLFTIGVNVGLATVCAVLAFLGQSIINTGLVIYESAAIAIHMIDYEIEFVMEDLYGPIQEPDAVPASE